MMDEVPVPASLSALLLLLPPAWVWWRSIARIHVADPAVANALAVGLLVFANVLVTHVVGLITQSFYGGLGVAMALPALLGLGTWLRRPRERTAPRSDRVSLDPSYAGVLCFALLAMLPTVILFDYHDLVDLIGHMPTASQIVNGVYPPRSMSSADRLWVYHYAIDQLFASVTALLRIPLELAIDLVALALWLYTAHLFGVLSRLLFGRPYDSLGVLVGCFSGGLPWLASLDLPSSPMEIEGIYEYAGYWGNPPAVSNFLQYPWALGMPLILFVLTVLWIELRRESPDPAARRLGLAMIGLALATLALAQTAGFLALFTSLGLWAGGSACFGPRRSRNFRLALCAILVAIGALLPFLGGMIGPLTRSVWQGWLAEAGFLQPAPGLLEANVGFWRPVPLRDKLLWNLASFGVLPLGLLCLFTQRESATRSLIALMAVLFAVSWLVMNLFYYTRTWDIVKFACVGSIPLAVMSVGAMQAGIQRVRRAPMSRWGPAVACIAAWVALLLAPGFLFQAGVMAELGAQPASRIRPTALWAYRTQTVAISHGEEAAIQWLRRRILPGEMVLCRSDLRWACALYGGFPQPSISTENQLGYAEVERERQRLLRSARTPEQFQATQVCWEVGPDPSRSDGSSPRVRFGATGSPEAARCTDDVVRRGEPCGAPAVVRLCPDSPA